MHNDLTEWKDRKIEMTVAEYEAKLNEWYEKGRAHERDLVAFKAKLDSNFNMGCDRYINTLGEVLKRNKIDPAKEGVKQ